MATSFSPFENLINAPVPGVSSSMPSSVSDPGLAGFAQKADNALATATERVNSGPTGGRSGLGGDLNIASESVNDAVGALDRGSQAIVNMDKIHQNQAAMTKMKDELKNYGVDEATMAQIDATIGDGSDSSKNAAAMELAKPYILKAMSGKRLQKFYQSPSFKSALADVATMMSDFDTKQEEADAETVKKGEKPNEVLRSLNREKAKTEAIQQVTGQLLTGDNSDLNPEEQKSVLAVLKQMTPAQPKASSATGESRAWSAYNQEKRRANLTALSSNIAMFSKSLSSPIIGRQFSTKHIDDLKKETPIVDQETGHSNAYQTKMYLAGKQAYVVKDKENKESTVVLISSPEGQALATSLAPIANDIVRKRSGGTVTRTNLLRTMAELGLGEFAKWDILAAEGKGSDKLSADDISTFVAKDMQANNRWISPLAVVKAMRNTQAMNKTNWDSFYASLPDFVLPVAENERKEINRTYDLMMAAQSGDTTLWDTNKDMVDIESEPMTPPVMNRENLKQGLAATNEIYEGGQPSQLAVNIGKARGDIEGYKKGGSATVQTEVFPVATGLLKYIEEKGKTGGDRAVYEELINANYGTKEKPIWLDQALAPNSILTPEIRRKMSAKFNAAGQTELAKYLLAGDATVQGLNELAKKVGLIPNTTDNTQPVPMPEKAEKKADNPKEDWRILVQNGKRYNVLHINGKPTSKFKEVK